MGTCCASAVDQDLDPNRLVSASSSEYAYEEDTIDSSSSSSELARIDAFEEVKEEWSRAAKHALAKQRLRLAARHEALNAQAAKRWQRALDAALAGRATSSLSPPQRSRRPLRRRVRGSVPGRNNRVGGYARVLREVPK